MTTEPALSTPTSLTGNASISQLCSYGINSLLKHVIWSQHPVHPVPCIRMSVREVNFGEGWGAAPWAQSLAPGTKGAKR